ncbi:MAG: HD domain-containing protein [Hyphomicrobiales bacterium]
MAGPQELIDALTGFGAAERLRAMDDAGELTTLIPELESGRGFVQPERHYYTVLDHNIAAVAALESAIGDGADGQELRASLAWIDLDPSLDREIEGLPLVTVLRLAALVHDVAKPATATLVDGQLRFPRHGPRGAEMMRERLPQLGFGPEVTDFVARMLRYHLRPGELIRNRPITDRAVRRFATDLDGHVLPLMLLNLADGMATRGPGYTRENFRIHCGLVNYVVAHAWSVFEQPEAPLITGEDLIRDFDLESGRLLGAVLTSVRRAQEAGTVSNREEAMVLARETLASMRNGDTPVR